MVTLDKLVRKNIKNMAVYPGPEGIVGEVKLNQNESPYNLPKEIKEKIKEKIDEIYFNRYNEGSSKKLRILLGAKFNVNPNQIILGCGMDELLYYVIMTFIAQGDKIVRPIPSFAMYRICAEVSGARDIAVELDNNFELTEEFVTESKDAKLTFICRPNSQTGNSFDKKIIERIIKETSGLVFIDEAYAEFAPGDCLDFLKYNNVIIGRTFSKVYSVAGLRLGYLIADKKIIEYLNKVRLPWNLNVLTQAIGEIILRNENIFIEKIQEINKNKQKVLKELKNLKKLGNVLDVLDSDANFISLKVDKPRNILKSLENKGILVRNLNNYPKMSRYLRVSIGTKKENNKFLSSLKESIKITKKMEKNVKTERGRLKLKEKLNNIKMEGGKPEAIIFDIDGVLVDVSQSYVEAIKMTAQEFSGRQFSDGDIENIKSKPNSNNDWIVTYALAKSYRGDLSKIDRNSKEFIEIKNRFQELYLGGLIDKEAILLNPKILEKLIKREIKIGIVTSRPRKEALYVLERIGNFDEKQLIAQEDCDEEKPSSKPIIKLLERIGTKNAVYLGDTVNDEISAKNAGIKFLRVSKNINENVNGILRRLLK